MIAGLYARHAHEAVRAALGDTRVVVVNGARQSGKSTLARLIAQGRRGEDVRYLASPPFGPRQPQTPPEPGRTETIELWGSSR